MKTAHQFFDLKEAKNSLNQKQAKKLKMAASILKATCHLYDDETDRALLPFWGAGIITFGQPNTERFVIGITRAALQVKEGQKEGKLTKDHLFRVTETARHILMRARNGNLTEEQIEDILLERAIKMVTTRDENSRVLKNAIKTCDTKDDWEKLYQHAGVKYELRKSGNA